MPKRTDISKLAVLGAGPIVIGQACEFDYSGTQACKVLRAEGYEVVLINSNPATIMTDPGMADATYIEPLDPDTVEAILERERPDALLPTLGGQTALNLALALHERGTFERLGIELLGASVEAIERAEDRERFKALVRDLDLGVARSGIARSLEDARQIVTHTGLPCVLRPSYTLGGVGGCIIEDPAEFEARVQWALDLSPVSEVLIEESLLGWKEFEMEVMCDGADRAVIVCSIENLDPMGVHTGDSITVAPAQTLTDREYQTMRDASIRIIRAVGVACGGSNIQFSVDPRSGRQVVIEMNPRVSRSSALASKATGFPIAKIAALLAVGYTLEEIPNEITRETPACFEPTLDYVVTKIPRFAFEKFPSAQDTLTTQMKSVGEVMAIGQTFGESLLKALRGLEAGTGSLAAPPALAALDNEALLAAASKPQTQRLWQVAEALRRGISVDDVYAATAINPWFLNEMLELIDAEAQLTEWGAAALTDRPKLAWAKRLGMGDRHIGALIGASEDAVREARAKLSIAPVYKRVDTCAAEFEAHTPYLYSTYAQECEADPDRSTPRVIILGSGPNRIGQGIEFDYSCVKAAQTCRAAGVQAILVNCNPETVSTDHDTSDRLYFEPIDLESVLALVELEQPLGVIVQLGGQTPLRLAEALDQAGVPLLGTPADVLDRAEDRARFSAFAKDHGLRLPEHSTANTAAEAQSAAEALGYPVLVRPSNVLGGRAMAILPDPAALTAYLSEVFHNDGAALDPRALPLLLDACLEGAIEVDVDAVCDGDHVVIGGVMEQVERVGVHSGDSACWLPAPTLSGAVQTALRTTTADIARALGVVGLINVQYAVLGDAPEDIVVIEVNPRASRTVPFVSKATGVCLTTLATQVMLGSSLRDLHPEDVCTPSGWCCKEVVLPLSRFPGEVPTLRPEMRSTGEVMAFGIDPFDAFARAQRAAFNALPTGRPNLLIDAHPAHARALLDVLPALDASALTLTAPLDQAVALSDLLQRPVQGIDLDHDAGTVAAALILHPWPNANPAALAHRFRRLLASGAAYYTTTAAFQAAQQAPADPDYVAQPLQVRLAAQA